MTDDLEARARELVTTELAGQLGPLACIIKIGDELVGTAAIRAGAAEGT